MMSSHLLFSLAFVLLCCNSSAMRIVKITKWQDVTSFSNNIVAFTTSSLYYGSTKGYPINNNTLLKYGLINNHISNWQSGEKGHNMNQLLRPNEVCGTKALVNNLLKNAQLFMRLIHANEINKIREAIKTDKALFEYCNKAIIMRLLEAQENKLILSIFADNERNIVKAKHY